MFLYNAFYVQIIEKLSPQPPKRATVDQKMQEIANKFDVEWNPADDVNAEDMPAIVGHRNEVCCTLCPLRFPDYFVVFP